MVAQTTYDETPAKGFQGMLAEQFSDRQLDSYQVENVGGLNFGVAVERGSNPEKQVTALGDAANWMGITLAVLQDVETEGSDAGAYKDKQTASVMSSGRMYVTAGGAVNVGDEVIPNTSDEKFNAGTSTSNHKAYARSAASADGDVFLIELVGPQG